MAAPPKKKGALAALLSFGGTSTDPPEDKDGARYATGEDPVEDMTEETDAKGAAFDAFANAAGIPSLKRAAAREALTRFVKACGSTDYKDTDTEEE